ncbi:MAG: hypothetical protein CM1200mP24_08300 [Gammaproteobacteria bacterium]|nr:MAG: hypothetical protein CM1200mP24_08300 [Gammaproteobacteria bacterium]
MELIDVDALSSAIFSIGFIFGAICPRRFVEHISRFLGDS